MFFEIRHHLDLSESLINKGIFALPHFYLTHCLGYLYGSYVSTAIIAVWLFA